ncbi:GW dipeptide domain-containing protein [Marinilactibacillus psychrotolerans]|uniref:GW dipeptide domain-containing protein n=1 Tax=Marinilactibacillus psychrotolerans TaxID=191770 RepID=UPI0038854022
MKKFYFHNRNIVAIAAVLLAPSALIRTSLKAEAEAPNVQVLESKNDDSLVRLEAYISEMDITNSQTGNLPSNSIKEIFRVDGKLTNGIWTFEINSKESGEIFISDSLGNTVVHSVEGSINSKYSFEHSTDNENYSFYFISEVSPIVDHLIYKITPEIVESGNIVEPEDEAEDILSIEDQENKDIEIDDIEILDDEIGKEADSETTTIEGPNQDILSDDHLSEKIVRDKKEVDRQVATSSTTQNASRYYIVSSGDTLWSVANKFGVSIQNIQTWNNFSSNTIVSGQVLSINGKNIYQQIDQENKRFISKAEFIQYMSGRAKSIAHEKGKEQLYASVMIAQASLESNFGTSVLAINGNNLFGMKGSYNGNSIVKKTWEFINGVNTYVDADFKFYPNFSSSLNDNANRLRNGTNWDANFYNGTWVRRTSSYKDATKWLTGKYATDPVYNEKLNTIIETYNLSQYDLDTIEVNYEAEILQKTFSIDSLPWGSPESKKVASSIDYYDKKVHVIRESKNRSYALIQIDGKEIGWIDKRAFELVLAKPVNYEAIITSTTHSVDSLPWGTKGFKKVFSAGDFNNGSIFQVTQETTNGAYAQISQNGNLKGWIDKKAIATFDSVKVSYKAKVNYSGHSINSLPWGTSGYKMVGKSADYLGREFTVSRETKGGHYILLNDGSKSIGWIDKRAIESFETNTVDYSDKITLSGYSIDSRPWGYAGYEKKSTSNSYLNKIVEIKRETMDGSYAYVAYKGKELGWIDKKAFGRKKVNYQTFIINPGYSMDSLPWGEKGFVNIGNSKGYLNQRVTVIAESMNGSYVLTILNGKNLGWVDKRAIETFETNPFNYKITIKETNYSVDSKPWGALGYENISSSSILLEKEVNVLRETTNGAYAYIALDGKSIGWVDKRAFGRVPVTPKEYTINSGYSIDSLPWGEKGSIKLGDSKNFIGKKVTIIQRSKNNAYAFVVLGNDELGWIDMKALK